MCRRFLCYNEKDRLNAEWEVRVIKVKGVRLYGVKDIRLEEFELPEIEEDQILLKIICNGIAMSTL